jgi:hypothetical protein
VELSNLISDAVARRMTPDFIEKEVETRVDKLIVESIDRALRSYSDTGNLIEQSVAASLAVSSIDLPSYGSTVAAMVRAQVEVRVAEVVRGRLAEDVTELLSLAPATVKLSEIADGMRKRHEGENYGPVITVIVEPNDYGSTWVYLDENEVRDRRDKYRCDYRMLISDAGKIASATLLEADVNSTTTLGRTYGLGQLIRAYYACGTVIEIDEDAVVTSVGDY